MHICTNGNRASTEILSEEGKKTKKISAPEKCSFLMKYIDPLGRHYPCFPVLSSLTRRNKAYFMHPTKE